MNFKFWFILSEELYQNNTATVFHRTRSLDFVQQMMNGGFTAGIGDYHGPGLYTTYTLEGTTNLGYGNYVVKLKVNNLKEYFVLEPDVAKKIHGDNYKLKDQARILELTLKLTDEQWQKYQEISEKGQFGSAAASKALKKDGHRLWEHKCKGIIYNGEQDGKCICVYAPYKGLQFLAYAHAPPPTTVDYIEKNWVKSGKGVSIRSISDLKFSKDTGIGSTSVEKQYEIEKEKNIPSEILYDVKDGKYSKLKLYLKNNKLSGNNVKYLFGYASDKEKMAEILGTDNVDKLNDNDIRDLIINTHDNHYRQEMINFIIKYKTELSGGNVYNLLVGAPDKEKMAEILGQDNIDKLDSRDVCALLFHANDKDEMKEILGQNNIDKLSSDHIYKSLRYASNIDEMARILGKNNIDKLSSDHIYRSLRYASNMNEMIKILGSDNINKLTGDNISYFLYIADDREETKQILRKYYTGTNPEVISILNQ